eukprot:m.107211 g.107211  ORF g.107211 m.107211 type:complete len:275 (-) comp15833_c0_seq1:133-957(-)
MSDSEDERRDEEQSEEDEDDYEDADGAAASAAAAANANEIMDRLKKQSAEAKAASKKQAKKRKRMSPEELEEYNKAQEKKGLIYLSSLPLMMTPLKLRQHMSQFGSVGRVFCQPEDPKARKRRVKAGGHRRKRFSEAWVEFDDKKIAKRVAASLNGTTIGGKKGDLHYDDMWVIKYLPKFKWNNLTERIAYDNAVREQRLQTEMAQVRRETNLFVEQATKAKAILAMEKRHKMAKGAGGAAGAAAAAAAEAVSKSGGGHARTVKQREAIESREF